MLESKTVKEVLNLSRPDRLAMVPRPGTMLEQAMTEFSLTAYTADEPDNVDEYLDLFSGDENHAEFIEQAADQIFRNVNQLTSTVQNVINPHIRKIVAAVNDWTQQDNVFPHYITQVEEPELLRSTSVERLIETYAQAKPVTAVGKTTPLSNIYPSILKPMMAMLPESMQSLASAEIVEEVAKRLRLAIFDYNDSQMGEAVAMLALMTVMETPPPGTPASLPEWTATTMNHVYCAVSAIAKAKARFRTATSNNILYVPSRYRDDQKQGEVLVYKSTYLKMLDKGLTPEAVIGHSLLGRPSVDATLLDPKVMEAAIKKYEMAMWTWKNGEAQTRELNEVRHLITVLQDDLEERSKNDEWVVNGDDATKAKARLKHVTEKVLRTNKLESQLPDIVAAILLSTWYPHTGAIRLMSICSHLNEEMPGTEPDEIMMLAKIRYIGEYVGSMIANAQWRDVEDSVVAVAKG